MWVSVVGLNPVVATSVFLEGYVLVFHGIDAGTKFSFSVATLVIPPALSRVEGHEPDWVLGVAPDGFGVETQVGTYDVFLLYLHDWALVAVP